MEKTPPATEALPASPAPSKIEERLRAAERDQDARYEARMRAAPYAFGSRCRLVAEPLRIRLPFVARSARSNGRGKPANALAKLIVLYGPYCLCCGVRERLVVDHVIPVCKGGRNHLANLQPLCRMCDHQKGDSALDYRPLTVEEPPLVLDDPVSLLPLLTELRDALARIADTLERAVLPTPVLDDALLRLKKARRKHGVPRPVLHRLRFQIGRRWYVKRSDVLEFIASQRTGIRWSR